MNARRWLSALAVVELLGAGCGGGSGGTRTNTSLLDELGVPTNDPERTDWQTVHPLQRTTSAYLAKSELYVSGATALGAAPFTGDYAPFAGKRQVLLDDATSTVPHAPLFSAQDESWTSFSSTSTRTDSDGDGIEEVAVLYYTSPRAFLRTIRRGSSGYEQSEAHDLGTFTFQSPLPPFNNLQLAAGDLDGDSKDELVAAIGDTVLVLDDAGNDFRALTSVTYRPGVTGQVTTVAVGNVDADPDAEVVVVNGKYAADVDARYYVYSYREGALQLEAGDAPLREAASSNGSDRAYKFARVAIGDLDADNRNEIALAGNIYTGQLSVTVMKVDLGSGALQTVTTARFPMHEQLGQNQYVPAAAVLNADGFENGRRKELLAYSYILQLDADGTLRHRFGGDGNGPLGLPYFDKVTVGDFDGDGRDEVAYYQASAPISTVYPYDHLSISGYEGDTFQEVEQLPVWPYGHETTVCGLNIDDDALVLRYTGEYELLYTRPQTVAVLASPPYYTGQSTSGAGTTLSWSRSTDSGTSNTYGFYVGFSIGADWGVEKVYKARVNLAVDTSYDWRFTTVRSNAQAKSLTCPAGENQVIFAVTPHDVYYYDVVGAADPADIGKRYAIEMPRTPKIYPMELSRYDRIVGPELRVPPSVLRHRMGDPWSYPTRSDMQALFTQGAEVKVDDSSGVSYHNVVPISVTQAGLSTPEEFMLDIGGGAGGTQKIELSGGASEGYGFDFNLKAGAEGQYTAGGVFVAGRAGFHYGYSSSFTTNEKTIISGTVPNLPVEMSTRRPYSVGLFSYPYPNTDEPQYVVVNYWVEE